jgi:hypothetical protein
MNWTKGFLIFSLIVFFISLFYTVVTFYQLRRSVEIEVNDKGEVPQRTSTVSKAPVYSTGTYESLDLDFSPERSEYAEVDSVDPFSPEESHSTGNETETVDNRTNSVSTDTTRFPKVPEGFPFQPIWEKSSAKNHLSSEQLRELEMLDKALIALWNRGDHSFYGGILDADTCKVYPHYPNTLYVRRGEVNGEDGETTRFVSGVSGGPDMADYYKSLSEDERFELHMTGEFPSYIKILDHSTAGYDLYDLLSDFE